MTRAIFDALGPLVVETVTTGRRPLREVLGWDGRAHQKITVLVFVRHFACPTCTKIALELVERRTEIERLGAVAALIGAGSRDALVAFAERVGLTTEHGVGGTGVVAVTDPTLACHRVASMRSSQIGTFGLRPVARAINLYIKGYWASRRSDDGDLAQQGGTLVVGKKGELLLEHRAKFVGDDVPLTEIVHAILRDAAMRDGWML